MAHLPWFLIPGLGASLGCLSYHLAKKRREIACINLSLCFPEKSQEEHDRLLRAHFHSLGMSMVELPLAWFGNHQKMKQLAAIEGLDHLIEAQKAGEGVLLVAAHFTSLELSGCLLGQFVDYDGMYRGHKNPAFETLQKQARLGFTRNMIPRDQVREVIKALRNGRTVWYAPDQDYGMKNSVFIPYFGVDAATLTATHKLASLGKCKVIMMETIRQDKPWQYQIKLSPVLQGFPSKDEMEDTLRISKAIEAMVEKAPEQYLWVHKRFKTRPPGQASVYP